MLGGFALPGGSVPAPLSEGFSPELGLPDFHVLDSVLLRAPGHHLSPFFPVVQLGPRFTASPSPPAPSQFGALEQPLAWNPALGVGRAVGETGYHQSSPGRPTVGIPRGSRVPVLKEKTLWGLSFELRGEPVPRWVVSPSLRRGGVMFTILGAEADLP